jgi:hypothetical protein
MINPAELRKGNLLTWNPKLTHPATTLPAMEVEVYSISAGQIEYVYPNIEHRVEPFEDDVVQMGTHVKPFEELEPIPITPDILERAGFREDGKAWVNKAGTFSFEDNRVKYNDQQRHHRVEYLHQLQNAYFALTNEELEIDHS